MRFINKMLGVAVSAIVGLSGICVMDYNSMIADATYCTEPEKYGDYLYYQKADENEDGTYDYIEIDDCDTSVKSIEIPSEIEGLPVKEIGYIAFQNCKYLEDISIPQSVEFIAGRSFADTPWLKTKQKENPLVIINDILIDATTASGDVVIPDNVKAIGKWAFCGCLNLESVTIPDSVESIDFGAFQVCEKLESIVIPNGVTDICDWAFDGCINLKDISIPESVTHIGSTTFNGTPWLAAKQKENPLVIVNGILFDGSTASGDVVIPDNVTNISSQSFILNDDIVSMTIADSVTTIGSYAFADCINLKNVTIGKGITSIESHTFNNCAGLTEVIIPDNVTSIGDYAFIGCGTLSDVIIPDSVKHIGEYAFSYTALFDEQEIIKYVDGWAVECKDSVISVEIKDDTRGIASKTFVNTQITGIVIPESVEIINSKAFAYELTDITIKNPECVIDTNAVQKSATVYGYKNSTAEAYAEKSGNKFVSLDDAMPGDMNGDSEVTVRDCAFIASALARGEDDSLRVSADFNGDGKINVRDAAAIASALSKGEIK